ncbi:DinB family protein [Nocardia beijingensis]|uniref:DinB family protein n=1 Tax=Nocardia beijingensis TaxID=95162 RepID=UPI00189319AD|nr:DinB family protein [Nocardia beijingensis]MBF6468692.1 DinB family protein [Nocardia beijingensis]
MPEPVTDRSVLAADLERARADFHTLLSMAGEDDWGKASAGTRWSNEQLLFHMLFGYMVVRRLLIVARVMSRLPEGVGRWFAVVLNAATAPFDVINYYGSCWAARVYNRRRMGAELDRVIGSLQHALTHEPDTAFRRGMHYPTRWDPYFADYMTLADIYAYPGRHYDHHRRQLTLTGMR